MENPYSLVFGKIDFTLPRFQEIASRNIEFGFWSD